MPTILLAVDGSEHALRAAQTLVQNAAWYREAPRVHALYVHLPVPEVHGLHRVVGKQALQRYYREEGDAGLAPSKKLLERAGIPFDAEVAVGPVAETIVAHAKKANCDLIFIGTHGRTAAGNMLLGSVATKVLHIATVPVLLVR